MKSTGCGNAHRGQRQLLIAVVAGLALLLVFGPFTGAVLAQETEEKDEPQKDESRKFTNDDLKRWKSNRPPEKPVEDGEEVDPADQGDPSAEGAAAGTPAIDFWDSVGVATDSEDRGEAYWRETMTVARATVSTAHKTRDQLQSEMNRRQADFAAMDDPAARDKVNLRIQELFDLLAQADQAIGDAEQALSDLEDEARRSGALPGWLR